MADTQITNTPRSDADNSAAAWALAVLVLVAILIAGFFLFRGIATSPAIPNTGEPSTNIDVTIPSSALPDTGTVNTGSGGTDTNSMTE